MCHDSALLVHAGGASFLHCNDARLTVGQMRRAAMECGGQLDVVAVQMSGASWHPICYEYPESEKARISAEKRSGKFEAVGRLIKLASPRMAIPFAGPMCFLDPGLADQNRWLHGQQGMHHNQSQAARYRATLRGSRSHVDAQDTYDICPHLSPRSHWRDFSYSEDHRVSRLLQEGPAVADRATYAAHPDPGPRWPTVSWSTSAWEIEPISATDRHDGQFDPQARWRARDVASGPRSLCDLSGGRATRYRFSMDSSGSRP
jgi:UDP-MurNAc hydroxylase